MGLIDAARGWLGGQGGGGYYLAGGPRRRGDLPLERGVLDGYRGSSMVYRCVNITSQALASLNLGVLPMDDEGDPDTNDPRASVFNISRPPAVSPVSALTTKLVMWQQLELSGQAFLYMDRGQLAQGPPLSIRPIMHPVEVAIDTHSGDMDGSLLGYRVIGVDGRRFPLVPDEVLWVRYPDPANPWGCVSPLRAAAWAADLDNYARQWQAAEFKNSGGRRGGIVYTGNMDEPTQRQLRADFERDHTGPQSAGKMLFMSGDKPPDFKDWAQTSVEMAYIESRKVNAQDIMEAFGVNVELIRGQATWENQSASATNLWSLTLMPKLQIAESEIDRQLFPEPNMRAAFDVSNVEALKEQQAKAAQRSVTLYRGGIAGLKEARKIAGLDPEPPADDSFFTPPPSPFAPAAPTPPATPAAETPAPAEEPARTRLDDGPVMRRVAIDPAATDRAIERLTAIGRRAVERLLDKERRVILKRLEAMDRKASRGAATAAVRITGDELYDADHWRQVARDLLGDFLAQVYDAGGGAAADALSLDYTDLLLAKIDALLEQRMDYVTESVVTTTLTALRDRLAQLEAEAQDVAAVRAAIEQLFGDMAGWQPDTVARTEAIYGLNRAGLTVAQESGIVERKQWITAVDDRTCDECAALDLEEQPVNGYFTGGLDAPPEHPNCRCSMVYLVADDLAADEAA